TKTATASQVSIKTARAFRSIFAGSYPEIGHGERPIERCLAKTLATLGATPTLLTPRLRTRQFRVEDTDAMHECYAPPRHGPPVTTHIGGSCCAKQPCQPLGRGANLSKARFFR